MKRRTRMSVANRRVVARRRLLQRRRLHAASSKLHSGGTKCTDTTPPETTITSAPPATTTETSASFSFASSESGSSFECSLDAAAWEACASPKAYAGLALGGHQFGVRARDAAGNLDPSPATDGWTVEAAPAAPAACSKTVSSVSAAQSAVSGAASGQIICLADGTYGSLSLSAATEVTLRAEHPGATTIGATTISGHGLTLAEFDVNGEVKLTAGTSDTTIEHNHITGGYFGIDACSSNTVTCNDDAIIGNKIVGPLGEDGIRANRYHDANGDGIGLLVEGNEFTKIREDGNHSDCLQSVWAGDHLVFRRNYLHDNRCQGFFVKDQDYSITGIVVEDNLFLRNQEPCEATDPECGQPHIFQVFGPFTGFVMKRNTIWGDGSVSGAYFREGAGPSGTLIADNVVYRFWTDTDMSAVTMQDNTRCLLEGAWPAARPGETVACELSFANTAADDYRLGGERGVDWAPTDQHYGP